MPPPPMTRYYLKDKNYNLYEIPVSGITIFCTPDVTFPDTNAVPAMEGSRIGCEGSVGSCVEARTWYPLEPVVGFGDGFGNVRREL